jgi:hypothetical protein
MAGVPGGEGMTPLAVDLYCGLGGFSAGFLAEGYECIGFDIERHDYGIGGYPGQLVLQDVLTLHGRQFKDATAIVASPPCIEFSYMAMPWSRAKKIERALLGEDNFPEGYTGSRTIAQLTALFDACFRIQREACEAAGHHIPLIVENVRGAQKWVGRSRWHYGSFHLWGDVPALMPITYKSMKNTGGSWFTPMEGRKCRAKNCPDGRKSGDAPWKVPGFRFDGSGKSFQTAAVKQFAWNKNEEFQAQRREGYKTEGHLNIRDGYSHTRHLTNPAEHGIKVSGDWFGSYVDMKKNGTISPGRMHGKGSVVRKAASAMIARIPFELSRHIARAYYPKADREVTAQQPFVMIV